MPTSECIGDSANRLKHTRDRIARQHRIVDDAEFKPLALAFAIRRLKELEGSLAALERSHAMLLGFVLHEQLEIEVK